MKTLLVLILIAIVLSLVILMKRIAKSSKKDWETLEDLKTRASKVETKKEIETLHSELVEKGNKIYNTFVRTELNTIDGYLRGLYKNAKNEL